MTLPIYMKCPFTDSRMPGSDHLVSLCLWLSEQHPSQRVSEKQELYDHDRLTAASQTYKWETPNARSANLPRDTVLLHPGTHLSDF
jgi:hypothetical protein